MAYIINFFIEEQWLVWALQEGQKRKNLWGMVMGISGQTPHLIYLFKKISIRNKEECEFKTKGSWKSWVVGASAFHPQREKDPTQYKHIIQKRSSNSSNTLLWIKKKKVDKRVFIFKNLIFDLNSFERNGHRLFHLLLLLWYFFHGLESYHHNQCSLF